MAAENRDTLIKAEAGVEENTDIIDDMKRRSRFPELNKQKILISGDPTKDKIDVNDLMNFIQHPEMKRLFILDRAWYSLVTESMVYTIRDQFAKSYESDKKAILEGRMKGGNVLSRTDEVLTRVYDRAIVVINEMHDDYAKCLIILNSEMNLEYNNGLIAMRIFIVHKDDNHVVTTNIIRPTDRILVKEPVGNGE